MKISWLLTPFRASRKTPRLQKIDDFDAHCKNRLAGSVRFDEGLLQRESEEKRMHWAAKARFLCGEEFCNWLFILSLFASPLFGQESTDLLEKSEVARRSVFGQSQKTERKKEKNNCESCCAPQMNYRLENDFYGVNTFGEYLLWQTQEEASDFVITPNANSTIDPLYPVTAGLGNIQSASFNWGSGFRLGVGYTFMRDYWQALGQYTWYETRGSKEYSMPTSSSTQFFQPTYYSQSPTGIVEASNKVHFSFQMADLLAARRFLVTDQIQLTFSLGATGGYIKENFHVSYLNVNDTSIQNNWSFGGGGFRAVIDSNWHLGYGFGITGKFSFASILGQYSNSNVITANAPAANGAGTQLQNTQIQQIMLMPTTQIALGFDWSRSFKNCWISGVTAAIAGEFNNLTNLNQVYKYGPPNGPIDSKSLLNRNFSEVYMYGITVRLTADF